MLTLTTQLKLADLIMSIADSERKVEVVRQVLAEQRLFEPYTAFQRIDRLKNGYITQADLENFLIDNDIILNLKELRNVFQSFDKNSSGRITYANFSKHLLPKQDDSLGELALSRKSFPVASDEYLPCELEWALARVFDQLAKNFRYIEGQRERLCNSYDFEMREAFNSIDELNKRFFTIQDLARFLRNLEQILSDEELEAYFIAVDLNEDGRISYDEFMESVLPQQPYLRSLIQSRQFKPIRTFSQERKYSNKRLSNSDYQNYLQQSYSPKRFCNSYYSPCKQQRVCSQTRQITTPTQSCCIQQKYSTPKKSNPCQIYNNYGQKNYFKCRNQSPMRGNEETHLAHALKDQIDVNREIEDTKKLLSVRADFNLLDGFRILDQGAKGYINFTQFIIALEDLGVFPHREDAQLFFERYDKDQDGLLRYSDFCKFVAPQNFDYEQLLKDRTPLYLDKDFFEAFSYETRRLIRRLFNLALTGEAENESIRQRLANRPLFSIIDAFEALDKTQTGFVTKEEIRQTLEDNGIYATRSDVEGLLKKYDKNQDNKISYYEFAQELCPKSPRKY